MSKELTEQQYYSKKEEVINKFSSEFMNGNYHKDAQLHAIVELLIRDVDPYQIIEQLILERQNLSEQMKNIVENSTHRL